MDYLAGRLSLDRFERNTAMRYCLAALSSLVAGAAQGRPPQAFVRGSQQAVVTAQQGHQPFVLAPWSLDCMFCRDDLALLGGLTAKHRRLAVVDVAIDPPERRDELQHELDHCRLGTAVNGLFVDSFVAPLCCEIDPRCLGELPRSYFHAADDSRTAVSGRLETRDVRTLDQDHGAS